MPIIDTNLEFVRRHQMVGLFRLGRMMRASFVNAVRAVLAADVQVFRVGFRRRVWNYVWPSDAKWLARKHGSDRARKLRRKRCPVKPKGVPLPQPCKLCGKKGRQWRGGMTTAGNREVHCGHCKGFYTIGARPLLTTTCPRCDSKVHQRRHKRTPQGKLYVRCADCGKMYTLDRDPAFPPLEPLPILPSSPEELW